MKQMNRSRSRFLGAAVLVAMLTIGFWPARALANVGGGQPQATATEPASGCVLEKRMYHCNWPAFDQALAAAHTATIETQALDRSTEAQLRHLISSLGKTAVPPGQPADLLFALTPVERGGIDLGPSDKQLATLRIYALDPGTGERTLLWAETFMGQPDRPWPTTAHALIQQFRARFPNHPATPGS